MQALPPPALFALNHLLGQARWAQQRLQPFAGRVAAFSMPPFEGAFEITAEGSLQAPRSGAVADVTISLPPTLPLLLLQGMGAVMRAMRLEGKVDLAEALGFVFRNLRWDAEEDLSRVFGDIAAHQLVRNAEKFVGWQKQSAQNLAENFSEYFTEEQPLIATRAAVAAFAGEVDCLRDDLARLEKRLQRLGSPA